MKLMERTKYLEPNFSSYVAPLVRYLVAKYKLGSSAPASICFSFKLSNFSGSVMSGINPNGNWNHIRGGMDVVVEEEQLETAVIEGADAYLDPK